MNNYITTFKIWFLKSSKTTLKWFKENKKLFLIWFFVIMGTLFAVSFALYLMAGIGFSINIPSEYQNLKDGQGNGCPSHNGVWYMSYYINNTYQVKDPNNSDQMISLPVTLLWKHLHSWAQLSTDFSNGDFKFFADSAIQAYQLYQIYWAVLPIWISSVSIVAGMFGLWALGKYVISPWVKKNLEKINNSDMINIDNH